MAYPRRTNPKFPNDYDLVTMTVDRGGLIKEVPGWWTGKIWEGLRLRRDDTVLKWTPLHRSREHFCGREGSI